MKRNMYNFLTMTFLNKKSFLNSRYQNISGDTPCGAFYFIIYVLDSLSFYAESERDEYFNLVGECPELFHESELFGIECSKNGECYIYKTTELPEGALSEENYIDKNMWQKDLKEFYFKATAKNSFKIDQLNFAKILKQWRLVLKEKPQYLLFWYDEQNKVYLETFEDEDPMRKRVDEVKRVVGEEEVED